MAAKKMPPALLKKMKEMKDKKAGAKKPGAKKPPFGGKAAPKKGAKKPYGKK